jgi:hypothetical protein
MKKLACRYIYIKKHSCLKDIVKQTGNGSTAYIHACMPSTECFILLHGLKLS